MKLRPHHLLCIQKFTGHGYDAAFTVHMTAVCSQLFADPQTPVTLTDGCDDLCAACPHNVGGLCDSADKVSALDRAVLSRCAMHTGDAAEWAALSEITKRLILQTNIFNAICHDCQWYQLCRNTEANHEFQCDKNP